MLFSQDLENNLDLFTRILRN